MRSTAEKLYVAACGKLAPLANIAQQTNSYAKAPCEKIAPALFATLSIAGCSKRSDAVRLIQKTTC
jgi:hypothetical protein